MAEPLYPPQRSCWTNGPIELTYIGTCLEVLRAARMCSQVKGPRLEAARAPHRLEWEATGCDPLRLLSQATFG